MLRRWRVRRGQRRDTLLGERADRVERLRRRATRERDEVARGLEPEQRGRPSVRRVGELRREPVGVELAPRRQEQSTNAAPTGPNTKSRARCRNPPIRLASTNVVATSVATVCVSVSRFRRCATSCASTPSSSAGDAASSPVPTITTAPRPPRPPRARAGTRPGSRTAAASRPGPARRAVRAPSGAPAPRPPGAPERRPSRRSPGRRTTSALARRSPKTRRSTGADTRRAPSRGRRGSRRARARATQLQEVASRHRPALGLVVAVVLRQAPRRPIRVWSVAAARAMQGDAGDVLKRDQDVSVQLDVRDLVDRAVRRQHTVVVIASEKRDLDLLDLVLAGVLDPARSVVPVIRRASAAGGRGSASSCMSLKTELTESMKAAMKSGRKQAPRRHRLINAAIKQKEVDERIEMTDALVLAVLEKMVKQRKGPISQYEAASREDLAVIERYELGVIDVYLPAKWLKPKRRPRSMPRSMKPVRPAQRTWASRRPCSSRNSPAKPTWGRSLEAGETAPRGLTFARPQPGKRRTRTRRLDGRVSPDLRHRRSRRTASSRWSAPGAGRAGTGQGRTRPTVVRRRALGIVHGVADQ